MDHQAQIWKIFQKHQTIPDDIQDLHFYIDNFKNGIEKEFTFLKEATRKNVENFQSSLNLQQTYSTSLCSHVNNIYNKLVELQWQLPHPNPHMNTGDTIQIEVPDFYPDINEALPTSTDQHTNDPVTQGSVTPTLKSAEKVIECMNPCSITPRHRHPKSRLARRYSSGDPTSTQPANQTKHSYSTKTLEPRTSRDTST